MTDVEAAVRITEAVIDKLTVSHLVVPSERDPPALGVAAGAIYAEVYAAVVKARKDRS